MYYYDIEQGSEEWHDLRRGIITASVAGKLITPTGKVANNDTVRQLAYSLAAERITGRTEETPTTYHMEMGHIQEVFARDLYSKKIAEVKTCGFIETSRLGFRVGYSPDGLVGDDGLIEIKSRMAKYQVQTICSQEVPKEYEAQIQFGLFVSKRKWIDFCQYSNGMAFFPKRVEPDAILIEAIEEAVSIFEKSVVSIVEDYRSKSSVLHIAEFVQHINGSDIEV